MTNCLRRSPSNTTRVAHVARRWTSGKPTSSARPTHRMFARGRDRHAAQVSSAATTPPATDTTACATRMAATLIRFAWATQLSTGAQQEAQFLHKFPRATHARHRPTRTRRSGAGFQIDTTKKITVVTQFITSDNTDSGDLSEIRRVWVQDGKVIQTPESLNIGKAYVRSVGFALASTITHRLDNAPQV